MIQPRVAAIGEHKERPALQILPLFGSLFFLRGGVFCGRRVLDIEFFHHRARVLVGLCELHQLREEGIVAIGESLGLFDKALALLEQTGGIASNALQCDSLAIEVFKTPSQCRGGLP